MTYLLKLCNSYLYLCYIFIKYWSWYVCLCFVC